MDVVRLEKSENYYSNETHTFISNSFKSKLFKLSPEAICVFMFLVCFIQDKDFVDVPVKDIPLGLPRSKKQRDKGIKELIEAAYISYVKEGK